MLGEPETIPGRRPVPLVGDRADPLRQRCCRRCATPSRKRLQQKWEKKWEIHYEACITDPKACCLVDGKRKDYDGYQGHFALTAHRYQDKGRPLVMDTGQVAHLQAEQRGFTRARAAGCTRAASINMQVEFWAQDNKTGKGLAPRCWCSACDGDAFRWRLPPERRRLRRDRRGAGRDDPGDRVSSPRRAFW